MKKTIYKLSEYHKLVIEHYVDCLVCKLYEMMGGRYVQIGSAETYTTLEDIDFEYDLRNAVLVN